MLGPFFSIIFFIFMSIGLAEPFIAALGYLWVDIVVPQYLAYSMINGLPLSKIAAAFTCISIILHNQKKILFKNDLMIILLVIFAAWITITTNYAVVQNAAWMKWNWAFKSVVVAIFMPMIFNSRIKVESAVLVLIFSAGTIFVSAGIKTLFGGGGYGSLAILAPRNTGLGEGSTLAAISVMLIPLMLYLRKHSIIVSNKLINKALLLFMIFCALLTAGGSFARTGLVALGVLSIFLFFNNKNKIILILFFTLMVGGVLNFASPAWIERMSTITSYEEDNSAMGRIAVWKWTIEYVEDHPFGGGFGVYRINSLYGSGEKGDNPKGKAFHNIFFEVLGEHGYPGICIYLSILIVTILRLFNIYVIYRKSEEKIWLADLSYAFLTSIVIFIVSGMFIGIAFISLFYLLVGLSISLHIFAKEC